jgi:hypothetical protein
MGIQAQLNQEAFDKMPKCNTFLHSLRNPVFSIIYNLLMRIILSNAITLVDMTAQQLIEFDSKTLEILTRAALAI